MLIAPSLLGGDPLDLRAVLADVSEADFLHVDIFDDSFVEGATWGEHTLSALVRESPLPVEVHLMVTDPVRWARTAAACGCWRAVIHYESVEDARDTARILEALGIRPGLAVSPGTPVQDVAQVIDAYDLLLLMTVEPGRGGTPMRGDSYERAGEARVMLDRSAPATLLGVDGGVTAQNIGGLRAAGVDSFVIGTHLFCDGDPRGRIRALREQEENTR